MRSLLAGSGHRPTKHISRRCSARYHGSPTAPPALPRIYRFGTAGRFNKTVIVFEGHLKFSDQKWPDDRHMLFRLCAPEPHPFFFRLSLQETSRRQQDRLRTKNPKLSKGSEEPRPVLEGSDGPSTNSSLLGAGFGGKGMCIGPAEAAGNGSDGGDPLDLEDSHSAGTDPCRGSRFLRLCFWWRCLGGRSDRAFCLGTDRGVGKSRSGLALVVVHAPVNGSTCSSDGLLAMGTEPVARIEARLPCNSVPS